MKSIGTARIPNHNFLAKGKMKTAKAVLGVVGRPRHGFGTAANAMAASPVGQWNVTFYLEPGLGAGATQGICYLPNGTWFSTTFHNWNGDWFEKGDRLRWYGKTGAPLATAEFGQFISNTSFGGEFAHFRVSGSSQLQARAGIMPASK